MHANSNESGYVLRQIVFALLASASLCFLASGIYANNTTTKPKPQELPAEVIAHLALSSPPGNQMVLQRIADKQYLYIQESGKQGFMIVNVTKPMFPSFVNRQAKATDGATGNLQFMGSDLGVAQVPDTSAKGTIQSSPSTTETVKLLDLTDPEHPKTLQTFKNVTSLLGDGGRGIIYLANDEGLWVLKHHRPAIVPAKEKRPCTSQDTLSAMPPDCQ